MRLGQTREERLRDHRVPGDLIPTHYELEFRPELNNQSGRNFVSDNVVEVKIIVFLFCGFKVLSFL